jgi:hypothetical protein
MLVVFDLMDLWETIGAAGPLSSVGSTPLSPSTRVPSCKHPAQKFCRGEVRPYL